MINNTQFRIIGRIGKVTKLNKVTHLSIASDCQIKEGETWKTETNWNTVTAFSEQMCKRIANPKVGKKGNLIIVESFLLPHLLN